MNTITNNNELHWVYQSIINWKKLSDDKERLKLLLSGYATIFYFLGGEIDEDNVHAYLGVFNNKIYLHFIPSSFDKEDNFKELRKKPYQMNSYQATDEMVIGGWIETEDALNRIAQWKIDDLRNKVLDSNVLHQAFFIPNENFKANLPLKISFALNNNEADLVIQQEGIQQGFYDTCRPVPPFPPNIKHEDFALLKIIDQIVRK